MSLHEIVLKDLQFNPRNPPGRAYVDALAKYGLVFRVNIRLTRLGKERHYSVMRYVYLTEKGLQAIQ